MASRAARKSTARPKGVRVRELPGAVFYGVPRRRRSVTCQQCGAARKHDATSVTDINRDDFLLAARLQRIRAAYERERDRDLLWLDLSEMGFESQAISRCVTHPARITSCGYGWPGAQLAA
jgi:hypothetical protein